MVKFHFPTVEREAFYTQKMLSTLFKNAELFTEPSKGLDSDFAFLYKIVPLENYLEKNCVAFIPEYIFSLPSSHNHFYLLSVENKVSKFLLKFLREKGALVFSKNLKEKLKSNGIESTLLPVFCSRKLSPFERSESRFKVGIITKLPEDSLYLKNQLKEFELNFFEGSWYRFYSQSSVGVFSFSLKFYHNYRFPIEVFDFALGEIPIISTSHPDLEFLVRKGAPIVLTSKEDLKERVLEFKKSKKMRAKVGRELKEFFLENYSFEKKKEEIVNLLLKLSPQLEKHIQV